ncbi:MAG: lipo-like protein [Paracoccaceae bacterium]
MSAGIGHWLGRYLEADQPEVQPFVALDFAALAETIRVGDVLLVEGRARISTAIKYLTQSTWSHAALCVADTTQRAKPELVEVTLQAGCHRLPLEQYTGYNLRLCRPASLSDDERMAVARYMVDRIGLQYDLRNIIDLARYLFPTPPVPVRWRRRMLSLGSGDPTRAICSSLIAQAFGAVRYPILPEIRMVQPSGPGRRRPRLEWFARDHTLVVPRDFDLSPYFAVVKPTITRGFDHRRIPWGEGAVQAERLG